MRTVLAIYLSLAIALTLGQLSLEYRNEKRRLATEIDNIASTFSPIIAKAFWSVDEEQTKASLRGVLGINYDVLSVELRGTDGQVLYELLSPTKRPAIAQDASRLWWVANRFMETYRYEYDLVYESEFISQRLIGHLVLKSNSNVVFSRAAHTFLITIISAIFKTTLLTIIFYWIMRRMVGQPLRQITDLMRRFDPKDHDTDELKYDASQLLNRQDELGGMVRTFQEMAQSLKQKDRSLSLYAIQLEDKVKQRTLQLEQASAAKSEFLASVSHEIRTPMNGIIGLAQLLSETPLNTQQQRYVEVIQNSGQSLTALINEILDHLKIESKKIELENTPFNISLFADCLALFDYHTRQANIRVHFHLSEDCPQLLVGDPTRIRQVFTNLLGNAFKFTAEGKIDVCITAEPCVDNKVILRVAISDTGIGIDASQADKLFKPFSQADSSTTRRYGGTGLGLAICKELVELMGGSIGYESEVGRGSRFWFNLPLRTPEAESVPQLPRQFWGAANLSELRILVAEDNAVNQMVIVGYLEKYGIEPVVVGDGRQALDYCRDHAGDLDLVLMDGEMPELDGWQATAQIRALGISARSGQPLPIVAMTAHAMDVYKEKSAQHGMNGFLSKPIDLAQLSQILLSARPTL